MSILENMGCFIAFQSLHVIESVSQTKPYYDFGNKSDNRIRRLGCFDNDNFESYGSASPGLGDYHIEN